MARVQREVEVRETVKVDVLVCDGCGHTTLNVDPYGPRFDKRLKDLGHLGIGQPEHGWMYIAGTSLPGDPEGVDNDKHFCRPCTGRIVDQALKGI